MTHLHLSRFTSHVLRLASPISEHNPLTWTSQNQEGTQSYTEVAQRHTEGLKNFSVNLCDFSAFLCVTTSYSTYKNLTRKVLGEPFTSCSSRFTLPLLWLVPLLLAGFWLRLSYLLGANYFFDEFISMLAAQMVAKRGLPILPSGLFYDHGLLLSYLSGVFIAGLGFSETIARWPVLLLSVFILFRFKKFRRDRLQST